MALRWIDLHIPVNADEEDERRKIEAFKKIYGEQIEQGMEPIRELQVRPGLVLCLFRHPAG